MLELNSKNYDHVDVMVRGSDKPLILATGPGLKLMAYLTAESKSTHVKLNMRDGEVIVVKVTDILRVEPSERVKALGDYA